MLKLVVLIFFTIGFSESPLSSRYHTYDEVRNQLFEWNETYGNEVNPNHSNGGIMYELMEIGQSHEESLPFWAAKISYNVNENIDKPKILILGQCHAEEILGVEISMAIIDILLHPNPISNPDAPQVFGSSDSWNAYRPNQDLTISNINDILEKSEIWVVPTHNPEGLSVVHGWYNSDGVWEQDVTFRKNKHDLDGNNIFNYIVGQGNDSDGVDLNRNYDFNWVFGADLYAVDGGASCNSSYFTDFDYFKGPSAFSELEIQAVRDLALEENFLTSIAYHSSRSGCLSEKVKYSWEWSGEKYPPDADILSKLGENIAGLIGKVGSGTYEPSFSGSFKGVAHNWFYARTGCFQYLIEVGEGGEGMQPNEVENINGIIHNNLKGAFYAMNRTAGINSGAFGAESYMVSGIVSDELTNLPIENAEVKILELDGLVLTPRLTDEFGRYRRLLVDESYTLEVNAIGYESKQISFTPSSSSIYELDISLNSSQISNLNISVTDVGDLSDNIIMVVNHQNGLADSIKLNIGNQVIEYPLGSYKVSVYADGKMPQFFDLILNQTDTELLINLTYESVIYSFDFENNAGLFLEDGDWLIDDSKIKSQIDLKYSSDLNSTMKLSSPISIDSDKNYLLKLNLQYELEWEEDSLLIELKGWDDIFLQYH